MINNAKEYAASQQRALGKKFNKTKKKINGRELLTESLNDFVFRSESSARANLIRIASGRNT